VGWREGERLKPDISKRSYQKEREGSGWRELCSVRMGGGGRDGEGKAEGQKGRRGRSSCIFIFILSW
jgi:hypothetical protein